MSWLYHKYSIVTWETRRNYILKWRNSKAIFLAQLFQNLLAAKHKKKELQRCFLHKGDAPVYTAEKINNFIAVCWTLWSFLFIYCNLFVFPWIWHKFKKEPHSVYILVMQSEVWIEQHCPSKLVQFLPNMISNCPAGRCDFINCRRPFLTGRNQWSDQGAAQGGLFPLKLWRLAYTDISYIQMFRQNKIYNTFFNAYHV